MSDRAGAPCTCSCGFCMRSEHERCAWNCGRPRAAVVVDPHYRRRPLSRSAAIGGAAVLALLLVVVQLALFDIEARAAHGRTPHWKPGIGTPVIVEDGR